MGEILSQSEIDALLNTYDEDGGADIIEEENGEEEAKLYNFATPSKFSKEQLRAFELIFDNYSRLLSSYLTGYLRTTTQVEVVGAEEVIYSEFSNSLVNPVILSILDLKPLKGSVVFEVSASIGYTVIDRILGGPGVTVSDMRDFTEIETVLLKRVITQMLTFIPEAWQDVMEIEPVLKDIETNTQFAQIIAPTETTALVTMSIKLGSVEGFINICIPHIVVEPVMEKINTRFWFATTDEEDEIDTEEIEKKLEKTSVPVKAVLGKTNILVSDFLGLTAGDTIPLDSYVNSDVDVFVGDLLKFRAKPGTSRGKNAIQITSKVEEEE